MVKRADGTAILILGSANLTRKNLNNFNLETNICLDLVPGSGTGTEVDNYFDSLWYNRGAMLTKEYAYFADRGILKTLQYRIQEFSGLSTY
jgi:HKD family nuclease